MQTKPILWNYMLSYHVKLHMVAFPNHDNFFLGTRENLYHRTSKQAINPIMTSLVFVSLKKNESSTLAITGFLFFFYMWLDKVWRSYKMLINSSHQHLLVWDCIVKHFISDHFFCFSIWLLGFRACETFMLSPSKETLPWSLLIISSIREDICGFPTLVSLLCSLLSQIVEFFQVRDSVRGICWRFFLLFGFGCFLC